MPVTVPHVQGVARRAEQILPGPYVQRLRDELNRQLDDLGVERVLGAALVDVPDTAPGESAPSPS